MSTLVVWNITRGAVEAQINECAMKVCIADNLSFMLPSFTEALKRNQTNFLKIIQQNKRILLKIGGTFT